MIWERVLVRRLPGGGFIAEARDGPFFKVGAICKTAEAAMASACEALDAERSGHRAIINDFEDLL